ncbi:MAG TPA: hypothetical protein VM715_09870 [Candidatus Acidoferrum sp.]|nr:hypothetical protein [Candidatus Acidoferrum sp.]
MIICALLGLTRLEILRRFQQLIDWAGVQLIESGFVLTVGDVMIS